MSKSDLWQFISAVAVGTAVAAAMGSITWMEALVYIGCVIVGLTCVKVLFFNH